MKAISTWLAICLTVFMSGCGGMLKGKEAGKKGVVEFHGLYNEGKFDEIYSAAHEKFKSAATEAEFRELIEAVKNKLGNVTGTSTVKMVVHTSNAGTFVGLQQQTTFEQGSAREAFKFQMVGDKAILTGYDINSKDLLLK